MGLFHKHRWRIISAHDYRTTAVDNYTGHKRTTEYYTIVGQECVGCGKIDSRSINGHHAKELKELIARDDREQKIKELSAMNKKDNES